MITFNSVIWHLMQLNFVSSTMGSSKQIIPCDYVTHQTFLNVAIVYQQMFAMLAFNCFIVHCPVQQHCGVHGNQ